MQKGSVFALLLGLVALARINRCEAAYTQPEQVHLAYGAVTTVLAPLLCSTAKREPKDPTTEMYVVWATQDGTTTASVQYFDERSNLTRMAHGASRSFRNEITTGRIQYVHRVKLTGLTPGGKYFYKCGSSTDGWSKWFSFRAMKNGTDWSPRLAVYGDLGSGNAQSLPRLQKDSKQGMYDAILHVGDFAYNLYSDDGRTGDDFMRQIEPIAANIPYMTCPGNHEGSSNFTSYRHRFVMPGDELGDLMFFSFNMGPAHIISFSTEYYFFLSYGYIQAIHQFKWLEKDLKEATEPANRAKRPWIITMGHRPMYCSNSDGDDCTKQNSTVRTGVPKPHIPGLENLFYKYGVDLTLWAHEHAYERLWPLYNTKMYNGSRAEPYTNPGAPVHVTTGSAGCNEGHDGFKKNTAPWSAFHSDDYGYTRMTIHNASHLYMEQVSDDQGGKIIDSFWIKKDKHGPYSTRSHTNEEVTTADMTDLL